MSARSPCAASSGAAQDRVTCVPGPLGRVAGGGCQVVRGVMRRLIAARTGRTLKMVNRLAAPSGVHPPARGGLRHPHHPGAAWTQRRPHDHDLRSRTPWRRPRCSQSRGRPLSAATHLHNHWSEVIGLRAESVIGLERNTHLIEKPGQTSDSGAGGRTPGQVGRRLGGGAPYFSRHRPCLRCPSSLHTAPYSAIISTVSDGHVGKERG